MQHGSDSPLCIKTGKCNNIADAPLRIKTGKYNTALRCASRLGNTTRLRSSVAHQDWEMQHVADAPLRIKIGKSNMSPTLCCASRLGNTTRLRPSVAHQDWEMQQHCRRSVAHQDWKIQHIADAPLRIKTGKYNTSPTLRYAASSIENLKPRRHSRAHPDCEM
ncbi:unnamed protein product [Lampetra planeri]